MATCGVARCSLPRLPIRYVSSLRAARLASGHLAAFFNYLLVKPQSRVGNAALLPPYENYQRYAMKLLTSQIDEPTLRSFGEEAAGLLVRRDYAGLAHRFGYALAYGRETAAAIEEDYLKTASAPFDLPHEEQGAVTVKYFKPNDTGLFALVECTVPVAGKAAVLLELIVTGQEEEKHITLEGIS